MKFFSVVRVALHWRNENEETLNLEPIWIVHYTMSKEPRGGISPKRAQKYFCTLWGNKAVILFAESFPAIHVASTVYTKEIWSEIASEKRSWCLERQKSYIKLTRPISSPRIIPKFILLGFKPEIKTVIKPRPNPELSTSLESQPCVNMNS